MKFNKIRVEKPTFDKFSENEKQFFVTVGTMYNEISMLRSMIIANGCGNFEGIEHIGRKARLSFLQTLITGKLFQVWEFIKKHYYGSSLSKDYNTLLPNEGKIALKNLKNYFDQKNWIELIRHQLSHHYDSRQYQDYILNIPIDEVFEIYFGDIDGQTLFYFSSLIQFSQTLKLIDPTNNHDACEKQLNDVKQISSNALCFLQLWFIANFIKYGVDFHEIENDEQIMSKEETNFPFFFK